MTNGTQTARLPHVNHEREWAPTVDDQMRMDKCSKVPDSTLSDAFEVVSALRRLTADAIKRHGDKEDQNLGRIGLTAAKNRIYRADAGLPSRVGIHLGNLSCWAAEAFAEGAQEKKASRATFELAGLATCDVAEVGPIDATLDLLERQFAQKASDWVIRRLEPHRTIRSYKFFPYFRSPDNGDFSFTDGWIQMRQPLANAHVPGGAPIDIYRQREVMLYLPRTDDDTRSALTPLSDQGWEHEGQDKRSHVSNVVARAAYERFETGDNPQRDLILLRDQILTTLFFVNPKSGRPVVG